MGAVWARILGAVGVYLVVSDDFYLQLWEALGIEDKMKTCTTIGIMIMFNRAFSCVNMALSLEVMFKGKHDLKLGVGLEAPV